MVELSLAVATIFHILSPIYEGLDTLTPGYITDTCRGYRSAAETRKADSGAPDWDPFFNHQVGSSLGSASRSARTRLMRGPCLLCIMFHLSSNTSSPPSFLLQLSTGNHLHPCFIISTLATHSLPQPSLLALSRTFPIHLARLRQYVASRRRTVRWRAYSQPRWRS